jgi:hypothetical protein
MMRCKGPGCDSIRVMELKMPGQRSDSRAYQCVKCKRTFCLEVGGGFEL